MAVGKSRGSQLGEYRGDKFVGRTGALQKTLRRPQRPVRRYTDAVQRIRLPMLQKIDPDGSLSLRSIAERLNQMNVPTISGKGSWSANSVRRLKAVS